MKKSSLAYFLAITSIFFSAINIPPTFATTKAKVVKAHMAGRTPLAPSNTILNGKGAPKPSLGIDGDFYIDMKSMNIYGPKTKGRWPTAISLRGPQGQTGATGSSGNNGKSGTNIVASGPQGSAGPSGSKGDVGAKGEAGTAGAKGEMGAPGPAGGAGLKGDTGAAGPAGAPGNTGGIGPQGSPGANGAQGPSGNPGASGAQGLVGAVGPQGSPGAVGPQGSIGATGATGATGAVGPQGSIGATGAIGASGVQGVQGNAGAPGATGPSNVSVISIAPWTLSTSSAGTGSDSLAFGTLMAGKSYKISVIVHGVQSTAGNFFGSELRLTSMDGSVSYEGAVIDSKAFVASTFTHRYTFMIEGTVIVGSTDASLIVRIIDGSGATGGALAMSLSGRAIVQLVGQIS
jgi:hypothetical protein